MRKLPYEVRINIADNDVPKLFCDCLCSGSVGFGALRIEYSDEDYQEAKASLLKKEPEVTPCWEPIITEILNIGRTLTFVDVEDEEDTYKINLETIKKNSAKIDVEHIKAMLTHDDDAITHDSILQTLILGEIVYG